MAPTKEQLDERYKKGVQKIQNELAQLVADGGKQENQATSPREAIKGKISALNTEKFQADQLKIQIDKRFNRREAIEGDIPSGHGNILSDYLKEVSKIGQRYTERADVNFLEEIDRDFKKLEHFK